MIDKENLALHEEPPSDRPNWAAFQARCTIREAFQRLAEEIRFDVEEITHRSASGYPGCHFYIVEEDEQKLIIHRQAPAVPGKERLAGSASLRTQGSKFIGQTALGEEFAVQARWNAEDLCCEYQIENESLPVLRVSQRLLESLFFPSLGTH